MSELGKVDSYDELRPANIYDVAANETWLEDQSAQGWHLTGFSGWSGLFARGEPKHCRYRMQPLPKKEKAPDPALMEAYQEMGWTYVATLPGTFHVWRCDDPGAPELDTDPVVQGLGYGYLRRRMVRDRVWNLLALAAAIYFLSAVNWASDTPLLDTLEEFAPGELTVRLLAVVLCVVVMVCEVRAMRLLLRSLQEGIPLKRPRPYRRQKWLARCLYGALIGILLLHLVGNLRNINGNSLTNGWDGGDTHSVPKAGVVYVDLRDLEGAEQTEFWSCRTKVLELCPRMYETRQLSLGEAEGPLQPGDSYPVISSAETTHYRLLTEGLARRLVKELSRGRIASLGVYGHPALTAAETDSLDELWWGEDRYYQFVLARLGRQVLFLRYEGETDLWQAEAYFASLLKK
ncbi:MAG: DUF2812 domain-containing protein [Oscillibacter sp.]|nr:DUF2812 domain-containing protein [Oscillibacter sp.]